MDTQGIGKMYDDHVAEHFDKDYFGLFGSSKETALDQIRRHAGWLSGGPALNVVDFALGTGEFLVRAKAIFPQLAGFGFDVSQKMIDIAQKKMPMKAVCDSSENAVKYFDAASMDLAVIHYVLAYLDPAVAFSNASKLLKRGGWLTLATNTFESFPLLQELSKNFFTSGDIEQGAKIPQGWESLKTLLESNGFEVADRCALEKDLTFDSPESLCEFGLKSSWLTQYFSLLTPEQTETIKTFREMFPMKDKFHAEIILARKK